MNYYYDPNYRLPYLFLSDVDIEQVRIINFKLKEQGITPEKVFDPPSYPAGDGKMYKYMIRLSFVNGKNPSKDVLLRVLKDVIEGKTKDESSVSSNDTNSNAIISAVESVVIKSIEKVIIHTSKNNDLLKSSIDAVEDRLLIADEKIKSDFESLHNQIDVLSKGLKQALELIGEMSTRGTDSDFLLDQIEQLTESIEQRENERKIMEQWHVTALSKLLEEQKQIEKTKIVNEKELFGTVIPERKNLPNPRVLVLGNSEIAQQRVMSIVIDAFNSINIQLTEKDLTVKTTLQFQKPTEAFENEIKKGYDYLIHGPMPHSVKGKSGFQSWDNYCTKKGLSTKVFSSNRKNLNKSMIEGFLREICEEELLKRR